MNPADALVDWREARDAATQAELILRPAIIAGWAAATKVNQAQQAQRQRAVDLLVARVCAEHPTAMAYRVLRALSTGRVDRIEVYDTPTRGFRGRRGRAQHVRRWAYVLSTVHQDEPLRPLPSPRVATFRVRSEARLADLLQSTTEIEEDAK